MRAFLALAALPFCLCSPQASKCDSSDCAWPEAKPRAAGALLQKVASPGKHLPDSHSMLPPDGREELPPDSREKLPPEVLAGLQASNASLRAVPLEDGMGKVDERIARDGLVSARISAVSKSMGNIIGIAMDGKKSRKEVAKEMGWVAVNLGKDLLVAGLSVGFPVLGSMAGIGLDLFVSIFDKNHEQQQPMTGKQVEKMLSELKQEMLPEIEQISWELIELNNFKRDMDEVFGAVAQFSDAFLEAKRDLSMLGSRLHWLDEQVEQAMGHCGVPWPAENCNDWMRFGGLSVSVAFLQFYLPIAAEVLTLTGDDMVLEQRLIRRCLPEIRSALAYMVEHSLDARKSMVQYSNERRGIERRDHVCRATDDRDQDARGRRAIRCPRHMHRNWCLRKYPEVYIANRGEVENIGSQTIQKTVWGLYRAEQGRRRHNMRIHGPVQCVECRRDLLDKATRKKMSISAFCTIFGNWGEYDALGSCCNHAETRYNFDEQANNLRDAIEEAYEKTLNAAKLILNPGPMVTCPPNTPYSPSLEGRCASGTLCCLAPWSTTFTDNEAKATCQKHGGKWIPQAWDEFTCEFQ